jgi:hypothetical protein
MLNWLKQRWRRLTATAILLYVIALWTSVLGGFSTQSEICEVTAAGKDCHSYNLLVVTAWKIAQATDHWSTLITAIATACIAWFTLSLRQSTDRLWKAGDDQLRLTKDISDRQSKDISNQIDIAREANRAAQKSADAAVATERARFYVVIQKHNFEDFLKRAGMYPNSPTMPFSFDPMIEFTFKNYGKTPGIIREISHGLTASPEPPDPVYMVSKYLFTEYMIAAGEMTETQKFDSTPMFQNIQNALPLLHGQAHFWFYGRFDYEDVFGNPQVHRFYMRYVKIGLNWGFQPYDYKHYNEST